MRQTRIDYTLVAEGHAEYAFIPAYLRLVASRFNIQVVLSKLGFKGQKAGKAKVLKEASAIFSTAIGQGHQLLIVGVDLDKPDYEQEQPGHTAECRLLLDALGKTHKKFGDRIVHFVTIQAIEQWLAYQGYQTNIGKKYPPNSLESKTQDELKKQLYGEKSNEVVTECVASKIASSADFDELARQSRSFKHFHNQVVQFLQAYSKTD